MLARTENQSLACMAAALPAVRLWPFALLVPLATYAMLVAAVPRLRRSLSWLRRGHCDRVTLFLLIPATILVSGLSLVAWYLSTGPDISLHLAQIPPLSLWLFPLAGRLVCWLGNTSLPFLMALLLLVPTVEAGAADQAGAGRMLPPRVEAPGAEKLYCAGRIVGVGESMAQVAAKCGTPAWQGRLHDVPVAGPPESGPTAAEPVVIEEWVYNFGAQRLLRFLRFRDGKLVSIRTGGYGFDGPLYSRTCSDGSAFRLGVSKMEVLFTCGEPRLLVFPGVADPGERRRLTIESDEWTYDFGPDRLLYLLRFRRGRVVEISTE